MRPLATHYGKRSPERLAGLAGALLIRVAKAAAHQGRPRPANDRQANRAALEICTGSPTAGPPPAALVDFALRAHGLTDPPPHMILADFSQGAAAALTEQLGARVGEVMRSGAYRRVGLAVCRPRDDPQRRRVVVALFEGPVEMVPIPRRLELDQRVRLQLTLARGYRDVQLVVASPAGQVSKTALSPRGSAPIEAWIQCDRRGVYRLEVVAVGRLGSEVLANFPVYCEERAADEVRFSRKRPQVGAPARIEHELVQRTNAFRAASGLPRLRVDEHLAAVARAHSADMRDNGFVGHVSPKHGGPGERIRRAGIGYHVLRENVARAYRVDEVMQQLINSPAHRGNLLSTDVTHMGIGVVVDRSQSLPVIFVTQELIAP